MFGIQSRRLNGKLMLLVGIRRTLSIIHQHFKTSLASEATGPIKAKFYVEPLWVGEMKVPSIGHGYITKMAAMLYMVITLKNLHSNWTADDLETWCAALGTPALPNTFKWRSKVELWPFYANVSFGSLCWYTYETKWVQGDKHVPEVKVILCPLSKVTHIPLISDSFFSDAMPLDRLKSVYILNLHETKVLKFIESGEVTWPRWPPCPYMVKTFKSLFFQNWTANDLETWYTTFGAQVLLKSFKWWCKFDLRYM